ncbi:phosphopantetheine-binding protein, partial [Maribacter sp. 2307UL18-2]|uniref:phosphopantetheine-binding protein n=1 Tax=Maribacter sp. 2307UL18-2 TaxID=3386274 RepID=UPI0039BD5505
DYEAPSNEIEEKLIGIWSDLLKLDKEVIGVNTNFFDLGGDSMKTMILRDRIDQNFNRSLSIAILFDLPTIASLANMLALENKEDSIESRMIEEVELRDKMLNMINMSDE